MFFLGAGFMLIETKAVVQMALLFGSTWIVNSIVFCAVLSMILVANLFVLVVRPDLSHAVLCGSVPVAGGQRHHPARCLPGPVAGAADCRFVPAGIHARDVRRRHLCYRRSAMRSIPTWRSGRTSRARWSAACPNIARCSSGFSTWCLSRWPSMRSRLSAQDVRPDLQYLPWLDPVRCASRPKSIDLPDRHLLAAWTRLTLMGRLPSSQEGQAST